MGHRVLGFIRANPSTTVAILLLAALLLILTLGAFLPGYDPYRQNLLSRNALIASTGRRGDYHLLGTDNLGRDLFSRLVAGGRVSVTISLIATALSSAIGCMLGVCAGYFRGVTDSLITGLSDLQLAVPRLLFVIAIVAVFPPTVTNLTLLLALTSWPIFGRVFRASTLSLREREFITVSQMLGGSSFWTLRKHILPHVLPDLLILSSIELGSMVMLEAALSYLGLGVQAPMASWGLMINQGQNFAATNPKLVLLPGIAIFVLVAGVNFITQAFTAERDLGPVRAGS
jgi:peptide/nickel transport system permease protein